LVRLGAADDERSGHTEVNEVAGPEWCSSGFDSPPRGGDGDSPSPATRRARPGHYEMMRQLAAGVRALRNGGGGEDWGDRRSPIYRGSTRRRHRESSRLAIAHGINGFSSFPIGFQVFVSGLNPWLDSFTPDSISHMGDAWGRRDGVMVRRRTRRHGQAQWARDAASSASMKNRGRRYPHRPEWAGWPVC
jgi:hypothetical protein